MSQDYIKAAEWFAKSAKEGLTNTETVLSEDYGIEGSSIEDLRDATEWIPNPIPGEPDIQNIIDSMYSIDDNVPEDATKAFKWYQRLANQGDAQAQYNLGVMYYQGQGARQNSAIAKELFGKACDNGDQKGCDNYRILSQR